MILDSVERIEKEFRSLTLHKGIVVSFFVYFAYFIFYLIYGANEFKPVIITIGLYLTIHALLYAFLKKGRYILARWLFVWLSVIFLINLTFFIVGPETGVHYFLLIFSLLALSLAHPKRLWISVFYFSISIFFFSGAEFGFIPSMAIMNYPDELAHIIRIESIIISFILTYYVSYMFYKINIEKEKNIINLNNKLVSVNEQLEHSQEEISRQHEQMMELNDELISNISLISNQKEELKIANDTKDKFFSIIAHDVKNPLSSIIGLTEVLQLNGDSLSSDKIMEYIKIIHHSANRIDVLLMNLLNWAKAQTRSITPNMSEFVLNELLDINQKLFYQNLLNKKIELINNCSENIQVYADRDMIDTVIRNLISNAIKFTPNNGSITLYNEVINNQVVLTITDNGIGMDDVIITELFKQNKRISYGTNAERGMGLGLLICKEFLELNNCELNVKSKLGRGSEFSVLFPVKE